MPVDSGLAALSDSLLLAAIAAYVLAMFGYTVEFTFSRRPVAAAAPAKVGVLVGAGPGISGSGDASSDDAGSDVLVAGGDHGFARPGQPGLAGPTLSAPDRPQAAMAVRLGWLALGVTAVGVALQFASILARGLAAHRVPVGNMYEFVSAVCAVGVAAWIVLALRRPVRHLGAFVMPLVLMLLGIAGSLLYTDAAPLVPALNSYWKNIHVPAAISASGLFMVGFVLAVLYLVRDRADRRGLRSSLPDAVFLERLTFRVHAIAFPIWTVAIILGAIWAEAAWSRYWGWDPKETWAFISWVVYAAYLHARSTAGWRGRGAAIIAVIGWATMLFNLFVINLVWSGLHSYAGVDG